MVHLYSVARKLLSERQMDKNSLFSAQVVVDVSQEQVDIAAVKDSFADLGFETGAILGTSFSISGSVGEFMAIFADNSRDLADQHAGTGAQCDAWVAVAKQRGHLPLACLPDGLRHKLANIVITRRPDFGP